MSPPNSRINSSNEHNKNKTSNSSSKCFPNGPHPSASLDDPLVRKQFHENAATMFSAQFNSLLSNPKKADIGFLLILLENPQKPKTRNDFLGMLKEAITVKLTHGQYITKQEKKDIISSLTKVLKVLNDTTTSLLINEILTMLKTCPSGKHV